MRSYSFCVRSQPYFGSERIYYYDEDGRFIDAEDIDELTPDPDGTLYSQDGNYRYYLDKDGTKNGLFHNLKEIRSKRERLAENAEYERREAAEKRERENERLAREYEREQERSRQQSGYSYDRESSYSNSSSNSSSGSSDSGSTIAVVGIIAVICIVYAALSFIGNLFYSIFSIPLASIAIVNFAIPLLYGIVCIATLSKYRGAELRQKQMHYLNLSILLFVHCLLVEILLSSSYASIGLVPYYLGFTTESDAPYFLLLPVITGVLLSTLSNCKGAKGAVFTVLCALTYCVSLSAAEVVNFEFFAFSGKVLKSLLYAGMFLLIPALIIIIVGVVRKKRSSPPISSTAEFIITGIVSLVSYAEIVVYYYIF